MTWAWMPATVPEKKITLRIRNQVFARAEGCCEYCQIPADFATQPFDIEHIYPRSAGGTNALENLALSCPGCNSHKYTKTSAPDPATGLEAPLFHPRNQLWLDHFAWTADYIEILGLTPTGRATVVALRLNRQGLCNMRRALLNIEEHPPLHLNMHPKSS